MWQAEVTEVVLHMLPTTHQVELCLLNIQGSIAHCALTTIIIVLRHNISSGAENQAQSSHLLGQYQFSQR